LDVRSKTQAAVTLAVKGNTTARDLIAEYCRSAPNHEGLEHTLAKAPDAFCLKLVTQHRAVQKFVGDEDMWQALTTLQKEKENFNFTGSSSFSIYFGLTSAGKAFVADTAMKTGVLDSKRSGSTRGLMASLSDTKIYKDGKPDKKGSRKEKAEKKKEEKKKEEKKKEEKKKEEEKKKTPGSRRNEKKEEPKKAKAKEDQKKKKNEKEPAAKSSNHGAKKGKGSAVKESNSKDKAKDGKGSKSPSAVKKSAAKEKDGKKEAKDGKKSGSSRKVDPKDAKKGKK
jgi:hypothetical protein